MKRIEFNQKNFGILSYNIGWCSINCPYCNKYHSGSFLFDLKPGQKEYIGKCERCGQQAIIDMGTIEQNDKLINYFKKNEEKLNANGNKTLNEF